MGCVGCDAGEGEETGREIVERALFGNTAENRRKGKRACEKK